MLALRFQSKIELTARAIRLRLIRSIGRQEESMSAKITVIIYILICFEFGVLLLILPWYPPGWWEDNYFLYFVTNKLHATWIPTLLTSGFAKGIVIGIGALNILAGLLDTLKFRESVSALTTLGNEETDIALSDHRPTGFPPQA